MGAKLIQRPRYHYHSSVSPFGSALTDAFIAGIAKGSKAYKLVGSYVSTPLNWSPSSHPSVACICDCLLMAGRSSLEQNPNTKASLNSRGRPSASRALAVAVRPWRTLWPSNKAGRRTRCGSKVRKMRAFPVSMICASMHISTTMSFLN